MAANAIKALLSRIEIGDMPWLDELMRRSAYGEAWHRLEPRELAKWVGPGEPGVLLLQLSSMHANGFVREEAVRRLSLLHDGSELPYLLLRLNDWVTQVRQLAHGAILERITDEYAGRFVRSLTLIIRLQRARRSDQREVLERITQLLTGSASRSSMLGAMMTSPKDVRRASFHILTADASQDLRQILASALEAEDPVVRLWAARSASSGLDRQQLRTVLVALSRDPYPPVRQEALKTWATSFPGEATDILQAALLDRSASVRAEARLRLGEKDGLDFRQFYLKAMVSTRAARLVVGIAGLAETRVPEDAKVLVPYLSHALASVRRTVVRYLLRLGGDDYVDPAFDRVLDVSAGVSNQASRMVQRYASRIGASRLWLLFSGSRVTHVRRNLLGLLAALPKWESITYLVRATCDADDSIAVLARSCVARWNSQYNRSQVAPSGEQLAYLESAFSSGETNLPPQVVASIRFAIHSFSKG